jgi:hypothetical protein
MVSLPKEERLYLRGLARRQAEIDRFFPHA